MKPRVWVLGLGLLALAAPALSEGPEPSGRPPHARERLRQELERRAAGLASALPSGLALPSAAPPASGSAAPSLPGLSLDELARKWRERAATREVRRTQHHAELVRELGPRLEEPAVKAELALHARRLAELGRIEFLAQNARSGDAREALLGRVSKLLERERRRHRRALERLAVPAASAAPSSPAPAASGVRP